MSFTPFTQDMVVSTNIASTSIILAVRIPPSLFVVHGEKPEMFNELNFKMLQKKDIILSCLTILNLTKFWTKKVPKSSKNKSNPTTVVTVDV